ncbi:hypothetical protein D3C75_579620 [compost metagenome]
MVLLCLALLPTSRELVFHYAERRRSCVILKRQTMVDQTIRIFLHSFYPEEFSGLGRNLWRTSLLENTNNGDSFCLGLVRPYRTLRLQTEAWLLHDGQSARHRNLFCRHYVL